jgi:hypothetical protein
VHHPESFFSLECPPLQIEEWQNKEERRGGRGVEGMFREERGAEELSCSGRKRKQILKGPRERRKGGSKANGGKKGQEGREELW